MRQANPGSGKGYRDRRLHFVHRWGCGETGSVSHALLFYTRIPPSATDVFRWGAEFSALQKHEPEIPIKNAVGRFLLEIYNPDPHVREEGK